MPRQLPDRPNLEQLKKQAKFLLRPDLRGRLQNRVALLSSLRGTSSGAVRLPREWQGRSHE